MLRNLNLVIAVVLTTAVVMPAATYYVREDGTGDGTGSDAASAWGSVDQALDTSGLVAGDIVYVAPGTYDGQITPTVDGADGSPITVIGNISGDQFADIGAGPVNCTSTSQILNGVDVTYLTFENIGFSGAYQGVLMGGYALTYDTCSFTGTGWNAYLGHPSSTYEGAWLFDTCTLSGGSQSTIKIDRIDEGPGGVTTVTVLDSNVSDSAGGVYAAIEVVSGQQTNNLQLAISGSDISGASDDELAILVSASVCTVTLTGNTITGIVDFSAAAGASGDYNDFLSITEDEAIAAGYTPGANDTFIPEPTTMGLLAIGGLALLRRRNK